MPIRGSLDATPVGAVLGADGGIGGGAGMITQAGRTGSLNYHYGYPAYGSSQPNVAAQWIFDEASGAIVDKVSSVSLSVTGAPTFGVTSSGQYAGISPGITYSGNNYHSKGADSHLDIGTSNFTIEFWLTTTSAANSKFVFDFRAAASSRGYTAIINHLNGNVEFFVQDETDVSVDAFFTLTSAVNDNIPHKFRFVGTRTTNLQLFIDGVSQGTASIATMSGHSILGNQVFMGQVKSAGNGTDGTLSEWRLSLNNTNNSGGPGGG